MYLTGEHCTINGNKSVLFELLYNLCDNGIRYNRPGGSVRISVEPEGERVRLTVADSGTGLGLSIVKHAAAYHHAEVQLKSEENVGTTITITF